MGSKRAASERWRRQHLPSLLCVLLCASFPVIAFHSVVFGGKTLSTSRLVPVAGVNGFDDIEAGRLREDVPLPSDAGASAWQFEPWSETVSAAYHRGELPLWDPFQGGGKPLAANMQSVAFDPLFLGVSWRASPRMIDYSIIGAFCIGSVAMFLFVRSLRARRVSAVVSAGVLSFGGYWFLSANNHFSRAYIYLPLLLYLVNKAIERGIGPWTFGLSLGIAGSILVGMPESTFLVLFAVGVYVVYRVICAGRDRWRAVAAHLGLAAGLGVAITLPLLVLFAEYEPLSFHTHKSGAGNGTLVDPAGWMVDWLVPFVNESSTRAWIGGAAFACAALTIAATPRFLRARQVLPFGLLTAFFVWKIYGFPGSKAAGHLPMFEQIKWPTFGVPVLQILMAILAGLGVDALLRRQIVVRRLRIVGTGIVGLFLFAAIANADVRAALESSEDWRAIAFGVLAVGVVLVVAMWHSSKRRVPYVALVLVAALAIELVVLTPAIAYSDRFDPFLEQGWFQHLASARADPHPDEQPTRVFGLDGKLYPETASAVQIYDVRTLDALYVKRYFDLVRTFVDHSIHDRFVGMAEPPETGSQYVNNPIFDLLGVRYLLSGATDPASLIVDMSQRPRVTGTKTKVVTMANGARYALKVRPGTTVTLPVPDDIVAVEGGVATIGSAPVTFEIVGVEPGGATTVLASVTPDVPRTWTAARATFSPGTYDQIGFRAASPDPTARGAWGDVFFYDADGNHMSSQYRFLGRDNLTSVYEHLDPTPRAFVVHDVVRVADEAAALRRLRRASTRIPNGPHLVDRAAFDPRTTAIVEGSAPVKTGATNCAPATVDFAQYTAGKVRLKVDAPCPGLVVLTDTYYPGWRATVNGTGTEILPTDVAFRGVAVPSGRSTVVMTYEPPRLKPAIAVSALALLAGIALSVWGWMRSRRRHATRPVGTGLRR